MFKPGDKVRRKDGNFFKVVTIDKLHTSHENSYWLKETDSWIQGYMIEHAIKYEDGWTLNDGKVEIPSDAKVLKDDTGDVVAFKKVEKPVVKEYVRFAGKNLAADTYETTQSISSKYQYKIIFIETDGVLTDVRLG